MGVLITAVHFHFMSLFINVHKNVIVVTKILLVITYVFKLIDNE